MNLRRNLRGWLLWLALLLPLAQAMAGAHALSHAGGDRADGLVHLTHCDLCLTAANLGSGAPATQPSLPDTGRAGVAQPAAAAACLLRPADAGLPPARAPPTSA